MINQDGAICGREYAGLVPDGRNNKHGAYVLDVSEWKELHKRKIE